MALKKMKSALKPKAKKTRGGKPKGKRIVGTAENGDYLVNYGSGAIPKAEGDTLIKRGVLRR